MTAPVVICQSLEDADALREAVLSALYRRGERAHPALRNVRFVVIGDHSRPLETHFPHSPLEPVHHRFMSYAEAAKAAHVSTSTIRRRVKDGTLQRHGRRLTAGSVHRWIEGGTP